MALIYHFYRAVQNTTKIVKMSKSETKQNQYILATNESRKLVPLKMGKKQLMKSVCILNNVLIFSYFDVGRS